jgi:hypothetical protein
MKIVVIIAAFLNTVAHGLSSTWRQLSIYSSRKFLAETGGNGDLLLPSKGSLADNYRGPSQMKKLVVDGDPVLMNELGPVIISPEGHMGSIQNWHELSELEKAFTMKRIGKRNQERLKAINDKLDVGPSSP